MSLLDCSTRALASNKWSPATATFARVSVAQLLGLRQQRRLRGEERRVEGGGVKKEKESRCCNGVCSQKGGWK